MQLDELARDRQAEARAVVLARRARVHLGELAEHEVVVLRRDADPRVADFDHALVHAVVDVRERANPDAPALRGEVDRVAEQVADDVRHLLPVGVQRREAVLDLGREREPLLAHERVVQCAELREHVGEVERRAGDRELVRRAARVGEDLADLVEQLPAAIDDPRDAVELPLAERPEDAVAQDLGVRDHRGERRAQVVRDVRKELRLERVARFQLGDRLKSLLELRLERHHASFSAGRLREWLGRGGIRAIHGSEVYASAPPPPVPAVTDDASASSSSIDSSSCWRCSSAA